MRVMPLLLRTLAGRLAHRPALLALLVLAPAWAARAEAPTLAQLVAEKAGAVELLHRKAEKNLVTAAQDPVLSALLRGQE